MQEIYESVTGDQDFSFAVGHKQYTKWVVNVTFKYAVREFNRCGSGMYVRFGWCERDVKFENCACVVNGELVGIVVDKDINGSPLPDDVLGPCFQFQDGQYRMIKTPKQLASTAEVRKYIYHNGCDIDGTHYIRWKRSTGSARVGKCLLIREDLYPLMHKWEMCGLDVHDGDDVDLAGIESYISLTSSSLMAIIDIDPRSILLVDDYESVFSDKAVEVTSDGEHLVGKYKECEIRNSIWDGEGLIDRSALGEFEDKGMILLRNKFFKCAAFNTNLQEWFADHNITAVSQLNGKTMAERVEDIKLVTTPSSIKYMKFGTFEEWCDNIEPTFGIVKTDHAPHYQGGRMVATSYQLLNTINFTADEMQQFLAPTFDYMTLINENPAAMRTYVKFPVDQEQEELGPAQTKNDIFYRLLGINDNFAKTKIYLDFKKSILMSLTKSTKLGKVLVDGNYSTLLGNPIELLRQSIGSFDGTSVLGVGNVHSKRFAYGKPLLGARSPHITFSNVWLPTNVESALIDRYINLTPEVVCLNSIGEATMDRLAGCDFDSDTCLLTDNELMIQAARRTNDLFPVAVSRIETKKRKRKYTAEDKADFDIKTHNNLIGCIVNLSAELNSRILDTLNNGGTIDDVWDMYIDDCILSIESNAAIDNAKREYDVSLTAELNRLSDKYRTKDSDGKTVKPKFFAYVAKTKNYYDPVNKSYVNHKTPMDMLVHNVNSYRSSRTRKMPQREILPFSSVVDSSSYDHRNVWKPKIDRLIQLVRQNNAEIKKLYNDQDISKEDISEYIKLRRQNFYEYVGGISLTTNAMIYLLKSIESESNKDIRLALFNTLFSMGNEAFYNLIIKSKQPIGILVENESGNIEVYGRPYSEMTNMA